jgi:hypothetical protein
VPGATGSAELAVQDGSYFTGELIWEGAPPTVMGEELETVVDGVSQYRGTLAEGDAIEVSDPRVSGPLTVTLNADVHQIGDSELIMFRTLGWRIENDGGAWSGQGTALVHGGDTVDDSTEISTVVLTGEGDYEGHTLYLIVDSGGDGPFPVEGAVFVGEAPPFPEPPAPTE